jgi:hypothetical protein
VLAGDIVFECTDFLGAMFVVGRVLLLTTCTLIDFTLALGGWMVFAAFGTYIVRAPALRSMVSESLTFIALDELELRGVFSWIESFSVNVNSVFETVVGHFWIGGEYDERVVLLNYWIGVCDRFGCML